MIVAIVVRNNIGQRQTKEKLKNFFFFIDPTYHSLGWNEQYHILGKVMYLGCILVTCFSTNVNVTLNEFFTFETKALFVCFTCDQEPFCCNAFWSTEAAIVNVGVNMQLWRQAFVSMISFYNFSAPTLASSLSKYLDILYTGYLPTVSNQTIK